MSVKKPQPKYGWSQHVADDLTSRQTVEDIQIWENPDYRPPSRWDIFGPDGNSGVEFMRWYDANRVTVIHNGRDKPKRDPATIPSDSQVQAYRDATEKALREAPLRKYEHLPPCVTRQQQVGDGCFVKITFDYPYQAQGVASKVPDKHMAWGVT